MSLGGLIGKGNNSGGTDTQVQIWGLYHLVGVTVSVYIIGQDCGDFTVAADGSVTVPLLGTTLGGVVGEVSLANLIAADGEYGESDCPLVVHSATVSHSITVPAVIGQPYVTQGQRLRALLPADLGLREGPGLGIPRQTKQFAVLVKDAVNVTFGTSLTPTPLGDMITCTFAAPTDAALPVGTGFDGVWWETLDDPGAANYDSALCWQIDRPYPFALMAVTQFIDAEDR